MNMLSEDFEEQNVCIGKVSINKFYNVLFIFFIIVFVVCQILRRLPGGEEIKVAVAIICLVAFIVVSLLKNKKLYLGVNENNDLNTFIIEKGNKIYGDIWENENIESFTDKLLTSGKIIIHLKDNTEAEINLKEQNISITTKLKAILIKSYPDKVPEKWITSDKFVKEYMETGKLPSPALRFFQIVVIAIVSVIVMGLLIIILSILSMRV